MELKIKNRHSPKYGATLNCSPRSQGHTSTKIITHPFTQIVVIQCSRVRRDLSRSHRDILWTTTSLKHRDLARSDGVCVCKTNLFTRAKKTMAYRKCLRSSFGNSSFWNHTLLAHEWNQFRGWCFVVGWSELVIWWCMRTFELTWPHVDFEFRCLFFFLLGVRNMNEKDWFDCDHEARRLMLVGGPLWIYLF